MRILATKVALACVMLGSGCSTQRYESGQPAHVVAVCIAKEWRQSLENQWGWGTNITRMPDVVTKEMKKGYFVGINFGFKNEGVFFTRGLTGWKHFAYDVWTEVTDTASGSETLYHRNGNVLWFYHFQQGVRQCQETNQ
jgi:hypothetical protein